MQEYLYKIRIDNKELSIYEEFEFVSCNGEMKKSDIVNEKNITILRRPIDNVKKNVKEVDDSVEKLKKMFGLF